MAAWRQSAAVVVSGVAAALLLPQRLRGDEGLRGAAAIQTPSCSAGWVYRRPAAPAVCSVLPQPARNRWRRESDHSHSGRRAARHRRRVRSGSQRLEGRRAADRRLASRGFSVISLRLELLIKLQLQDKSVRPAAYGKVGPQVPCKCQQLGFSNVFKTS